MKNNASNSSLPPARERVRKHRETQRTRGLRLVARWVPDTRNPEFVTEYRRQALVLAASSQANPLRDAEFWDWAYAVQVDEGWS